MLLADMYEPSALVAGDDFFGYLTRGSIPPWLAEAREQNEIVLEAAAAAAGRLAQGGFTVVYDGVVGPWSLAAFVSAQGCRVFTTWRCCLLQRRPAWRAYRRAWDTDSPTLRRPGTCTASSPIPGLTPDTFSRIPQTTPRSTAMAILRYMASGTLVVTAAG